MPLLGSEATGLGSVDTGAGAEQQGGGGGGTITEITSADGSIVVTDPTGPVVDLSVVPGDAVTALVGEVFGDPANPQQAYWQPGVELKQARAARVLKLFGI